MRASTAVAMAIAGPVVSIFIGCMNQGFAALANDECPSRREGEKSEQVLSKGVRGKAAALHARLSSDKSQLRNPMPLSMLL
jgi:hypothetical protein